VIAVDGFIPLQHLYDDAYRLAIDQAAEYLQDRAQHAGHFILKRTQDVLQSWFEDFYEERLFLSNGDGAPIRLSKWAVKHRFGIDLYYYDKPSFYEALSTEKPQISLKEKFGICDLLPRKWLERPEDESEEPTEEEWIKFRSTIIDSQGGTHVPLFINYMTWTLDLSLFRFIMADDIPLTLKFEQDVLEHASFLEEYEGYSLCVDQNTFIENWESHWMGIGKRKIAEERKLFAEMRAGNASPNQVGRPRKREAMAEYFRTIFPNGRQGRPWKEVLNEIQSTYGISGSIETLKRGLKNDES